MESYARLVVTPNLTYAESINGDLFPVPVDTLKKATDLVDAKEGVYLIKVKVHAEVVTYEQPKQPAVLKSIELPKFA